MPELADIGVHVYNTVQPEIYDLKELKRQYGRHLTFYGGISTKQFLSRATVREAREMAPSVVEMIGVWRRLSPFTHPRGDARHPGR